MNRACRQEIAEIEAQLLAGHPDVQGLCLALADWSTELRLINAEKRPQEKSRPRPEPGGRKVGGYLARL